MTWVAWRTWNRLRWYWPRAQQRRRVEADFKAFYAKHGETWEPPRPWWLP